MSDKSLLHIYNEVAEEVSNVYVVPLIRHEYPTTDYLHLFYKEISENDSINIQSLSAGAHFRLMIAPIKDRNAILHYHWLEFQDWKSALGIIYKLLCIGIFTAFGGKVIWTVHNLYPHNKKWISLHKKIYRWMARKADRLIVHSSSAMKIVSDEYGIDSGKIAVLPHPKFPTKEINKTQAISNLNSDFGIQLKSGIPLIGCIGAISDYKGIPRLIEMISQVSSPKQLLIAGYVKKGMQNVDQQIHGYSDKFAWLEYQSGFISEKNLAEIMNALDLCVFNFGDILTSGGIEMALSYNKLILAPRLPALLEYEENERVHLFSSDEEFKTILTQLIGSAIG
ncbi:MAG: glycosyltransferase family 4 protein [Balneolaceae bacterium]|nr:glycosyltransferase family 4 protein [Balneolaceae bacterium]